MIDFRYHLVSIVAIFLALSLGLLLGSTELKPYVQRGLNAASKTEHNQIESLLGQKQQFLGQISSNNQFALANAPAMLHDVLAGQQVVLVLAPGAPGSVTSGVTQAVQTAGATVTGQLQLQTAFFDTSAASSQKLSQVAQQYAEPAGLTLAGTAQAQASELLAHVIMTQGGPGQPLPGERDSGERADRAGARRRGFPHQERAALGPCHAGCRDHSRHPAVHRRHQRAKPAAGHPGPAAEPGRAGHGRGRDRRRLRAGQCHRRDARRRPGRAPVQRGRCRLPDRPDRGRPVAGRHGARQERQLRRDRDRERRRAEPAPESRADRVAHRGDPGRGEQPGRPATTRSATP